MLDGVRPGDAAAPAGSRRSCAAPTRRGSISRRRRPGCSPPRSACRACMPTTSRSSTPGMLLYDAFYRWCRDATDETHNWPNPRGRAADRERRRRCGDRSAARGARPSFGEATARLAPDRPALLRRAGRADRADAPRCWSRRSAGSTSARFLHALNFCMLLPGPEAQQLATYVGWLLHGVRGGLVAGRAVRPARRRRHARRCRRPMSRFGDVPLVAGPAVRAEGGGARRRRWRRCCGFRAGRSSVAADGRRWRSRPSSAIAFLQAAVPADRRGGRRCSGSCTARVAPAALGPAVPPRPRSSRRREPARRRASRSFSVAVARLGRRSGSCPIALLAAVLGGGHVFVRGGAVLLEDGDRHLRRRLCRARLCRAAGGGGLSAGCARTRC